MSEMRWLPLESNPVVMNKYVSSIGADLTAYSFSDVFGLDAELLGMISKPVLSLLLLYPMTEKSEASSIGSEDADHTCYFIKQTIGNACGTIGLIHSILNNTDSVTLKDGKCLSAFLKDTKDCSPSERAGKLEQNAAFNSAHEESAQEGQTQAPSRDEHVKNHFVAFVHNDGKLYELDGRKNAPTSHGATSPKTFLEDAAKVIKKFMERDPEELNFTVVALAKAE